jgi:nucleoredoxin
MPWLSIPFVQGSAAVKSTLSQALKIQGIPTLVVIDAKTGEFISGSARDDVTKAGGDPVKAMAVIEQWKNMERRPLSESNVGGGGPGNPLAKVFMYFAKNPMYVFALLYAYKWIQKNIITKWYGGPNAVTPIEDDEELAEEESEF